MIIISNLYSYQKIIVSIITIFITIIVIIATTFFNGN